MTARCQKQKRDPMKVEREIGRLLGKKTRAAKLFNVKVTKTDNGAARIEWSKIEATRDWATLSSVCYLLRTNVSDWSDEELWKAYIQLTEAEAAFRIHKSDLSIRPIWHQKEERVLAHIFVCVLAYAPWKTLGHLCSKAGLGDEPRRVLAETRSRLSQEEGFEFCAQTALLLRSGIQLIDEGCDMRHCLKSCSHIQATDATRTRPVVATKRFCFDSDAWRLVELQSLQYLRTWRAREWIYKAGRIHEEFAAAPEPIAKKLLIELDSVELVAVLLRHRIAADISEKIQSARHYLKCEPGCFWCVSSLVVQFVEAIPPAGFTGRFAGSIEKFRWMLEYSATAIEAQSRFFAEEPVRDAAILAAVARFHESDKHIT